MKQLRKVSRSRSVTSSLTSNLKALDEGVRSSAGWKGTISMLEGQAMLQGQSPFTYILSEGMDEYHYFFHYVGVDSKVHFKNMRICYVAGIPLFRNGGGGSYENIADLAVGCLQCSASICKPLGV